MDMRDLESRLVRALARPLPGVTAQARLAPRPRRGWPVGDDAGFRRGAGLVLLYPRGEEPHLLLTLRNRDLPQHAGQVSLPGGAIERGETPVQAALREAHEEAGVDPGAVRVLGRLSAMHIPVSGFVLYPVVGLTSRRPALRADTREVERLLEVPLEHLRDPARIVVEQRTRHAVRYDVPVVWVDGERLWGATAMILAELLALLGHDPSPAR